MLVRESPESPPSMYIVSNKNGETHRGRQRYLFELIRKAALDDEDLKKFQEICHKYLSSSVLRGNYSKAILDQIFPKVFEYTKHPFPSLTPDEFYDLSIDFLNTYSTLHAFGYKESIKAGVALQNLTAAIHHIQQLVLNFMTIRYYYHVNESIWKDDDDVQVLRNCALWIKHAELLIPLTSTERHAEMYLLDYLHKLPDATLIRIFVSKKICYRCHSVLKVYQQLSQRLLIYFQNMHNIWFEKWNPPYNMPKIYENCGCYDTYIEKYAELVDDGQMIVDPLGEGFEKEKVWMFHTPSILKKALDLA